eukprot:scaffold63_cov306-Pinguiococcus_pyrenoidosus.AAC.12
MLDAKYATYEFADGTKLADVISKADFYHVTAWHALSEALDRDDRGSFSLPMGTSEIPRRRGKERPRETQENEETRTRTGN